MSGLASDPITFTYLLKALFLAQRRFTKFPSLLLFIACSPGHAPIFCQRSIEFSRQRSIESSYQRCIELIHPARPALYVSTLLFAVSAHALLRLGTEALSHSLTRCSPFSDVRCRIAQERVPSSH